MSPFDFRAEAKLIVCTFEFVADPLCVKVTLALVKLVVCVKEDNESSGPSTLPLTA